MKEHVLGVVLACLVVASAAAEDAPTAPFDKKYFTDGGNVVAVEGWPTGRGVNPDTNRWVLWCYQERRECLQIIIDSLGSLVSIITPIPLSFTVKAWDTERIVAQRDLVCGLHETWRLDRLRKTAEFFGGSCMNKDAPHLTIENPPSFTKLNQHLEELKRRR